MVEGTDVFCRAARKARLSRPSPKSFLGFCNRVECGKNLLLSRLLFKADRTAALRKRPGKIGNTTGQRSQTRVDNNLSVIIGVASPIKDDYATTDWLNGRKLSLLEHGRGIGDHLLLLDIVSLGELLRRWAVPLHRTGARLLPSHSTVTALHQAHAAMMPLTQERTVSRTSRAPDLAVDRIPRNAREGVGDVEEDART
jgi:hypothetical protein